MIRATADKGNNDSRARNCRVYCCADALPTRVFTQPGSTTEVSDGHENVRSWVTSGSRFRATEGLLVANSSHSNLLLPYRLSHESLIGHNPVAPNNAASSSPCAGDPKATSRFSLAQSIYHDRVAYPRIQFHSLHPPPFASIRKGLSLTEFCSGTTRLPAASMRDYCSGVLSYSTTCGTTGL